MIPPQYRYTHMPLGVIRKLIGTLRNTDRITDVGC